jgi:G:T/U-mismatch repair DNA glycosylase
MPGERSLTAAEYYAHPRNAFWKIMQEVAGVDSAASYGHRLRSLKVRGIALCVVLFNGGTAERYFKRYVLPAIGDRTAARARVEKRGRERLRVSNDG